MQRGTAQYRITRVVGQGAFGTVYEAERLGEGLSRRVAMKLLHPSHSGQTGVERRLRDEARMLSMVRHRSIVGVEDLIRIDGAWCVVMEWVPGADLTHVLALGPVPPRAALQIVEDVASALHAAWSQMGPGGRPLQLVHRDVKPQNIRVTPAGEVKLLDFGVARAEFQAREASTQVAGIGTVRYMAPERFRGEDTHAGDVYALGVTLFELLTGTPPGESAGDPDRLPPGRELAPQWTWLQREMPKVTELLVAMLEPSAALRPSARECARQLGELRLTLQGQRLEDWAESAIGRAPTPTPAPASSAGVTLAIGQTVTHPEPAPARRWGLIVGILSLLAAGAVATVVVGMALFWPVQTVPPPALVAPTPTTAPVETPPRPPTPVAPPVTTKHAPVPAAPPPTTPAPIAHPAPPTGTVRLDGASRLILSGPAGEFGTGAVAPGRYRATVSFAGGAEITLDGIAVTAGTTTTLACDEQFATCVVHDGR